MNLFRIMQSIRGWAQAGKIDFPGAVKYLTDLGVKMDGIVHQALKNVFKEGKARDPDFGNVVQKLPIDDTGVPFNPKTLKSTKEKRWDEFVKSDPFDGSVTIKEGKEGIENLRGTSEADKDIAFIQEGIDDLNKAEREADLVSKTEGIENLFDEKLPKVKMGSKMNYEKIAELEDIDVELIRGKNWSEIRAIIAAIRDKADGGRVGFQEGGWADDLTGQALALYNSMTAGGHSDQTIQDTLTELGYWSADGGAEGIETITTTAPDMGGGGGGGRDGITGGIGLFDDLDPKTEKDFTAGVWSTDMVSTPPSQYAPMTASYKPETKKIAQDAQGNWKYVDTNTNVYHANLDQIKPLAAGIFESITGMDLTGKHGLPKDFTKHKLGSTQGYEYGTQKPWQRVRDQWSKYQADQKIKSDFRRMQKELDAQAAIDLANKQAAASIGATTVLPQHHQEQGGGGYQDAPIHTAPKSHTAPSQTGYMGPGGKHYNTGGLATMFTRRR